MRFPCWHLSFLFICVALFVYVRVDGPSAGGFVSEICVNRNKRALFSDRSARESPRDPASLLGLFSMTGQLGCWSDGS